MMEIVDTHVHVWDLDRERLPWLDAEGPILKRNWSPADYAKELRIDQGYSLEQAIYIEIDRAHDERAKENQKAIELVNDPLTLFAGACISGTLTSSDFADYIEQWSTKSQIKGVRQVLHVPSSPPHACLTETFINNVRLLGEKGLVYEACLRCEELEDLVTVAKECPETTVVLDHMGIVDADIVGVENPVGADRDYKEAWQHHLQELGALSNVICKVSGLNPMREWSTDTLARAVKPALEAFDADKVMFASNFPVLNVAMSLDQWIVASLEITSDMKASDREAFFANNARRVYGLSRPAV
jgi:predicted TIM-barrel fold metal-dependent hydrolase